MKYTVLFLFLSLQLAAQTDNSTRVFKNNIHLNIAPMIIFGKNNYVLGYERVINKHQSITINLGYWAFSPMKEESSSDLTFNRKIQSTGYSVALDYRFYLRSENKYNPPRGVYIAPYFGSYNLIRTDNIKIHLEEPELSYLDLRTKFGLNSLGIQLGYQFVIMKRISLDFILMGPSLTYYNLNLSLKGDLGGLAENEFFQQVVEILLDKYPWMQELVDKTEISSKGRLEIWSLGFRYGIQIGFVF